MSHAACSAGAVVQVWCWGLASGGIEEEAMGKHSDPVPVPFPLMENALVLLSWQAYYEQKEH